MLNSHIIGTIYHIYSMFVYNPCSKKCFIKNRFKNLLFMKANLLSILLEINIYFYESQQNLKTDRSKYF